MAYAWSSPHHATLSLVLAIGILTCCAVIWLMLRADLRMLKEAEEAETKGKPTAKPGSTQSAG